MKNKQFFKSLSLAAALVVAGLCGGGAAQTATAQTYNINIGTVSSSGSGYTYSSGVATLTTNGGNYVISGSSTTKGIKVQSGITVNITLNSVNIDLSTIENGTALDIEDATAYLTLQGVNSLKSGKYSAAINVPLGATLNIDGNGTLNATGGNWASGIGGYWSNAAAGTIIINGGNIIVTTEGYGSGIGGSYGGPGGNVTINGGTVIATGGSYSGAGIGAGESGYGNGTLIIDGGSVRIIGSNSAATPYNSAGARLNQAVLTVYDPPVVNTAVTAGAIGGVNCSTSPNAANGVYGIKDIKTNSEGVVYLWLPEGNDKKLISLTVGGTKYYSVVILETNAYDTMTLLIPVINEAHQVSVTYDGNPINLLSPTLGLFTIDPDAGTPTLTLDNDMLDMLDLPLDRAPAGGFASPGFELQEQPYSAGNVGKRSVSGSNLITALPEAPPNGQPAIRAGANRAGSGTITSTTLTVTSAGRFAVSLKTGATLTHQAGDEVWAVLTVNKALQAQPTGLAATAETIRGANDGKISGINDAMEYRLSTFPTYTACTGTTITGLEPGIYYVRFQETELFLPSDSVRVTVAAGRVLTPPVITTPAGALTGGTVDVPYTKTLAASNSPTSWALSSGSLPQGLTLSGGSGVISGTPTVANTYSFSITATNDDGVSAAVTFSITIAKGAQPAPMGLSATDETAAGAKDGTITGITDEMEYKLATASSYIRCSGATITSLAPGTYYVRYVETANYNASPITELTVRSSTLSSPIITTSPDALPQGVAGTYYSIRLTASGSPEPTWSIVSGALPDGLTLNASSGEISGTPVAAGSFDFTVQASNGVGTDATQSFTITIVANAATVTFAPSPTSPVYNGSPQALVYAGYASGGTMKYSLTSGGSYGENVPSATNAGSYTVYYIVEGDANHSNAPEASIVVTIDKKSVTVTAPSLSVARGEALPPLPAADYEGWIYPDNAATALSSYATAKYNVSNSNTLGESPITFSTSATLNSGAGANYTLTYVNGTLLVYSPTDNATVATNDVSPVIWAYDGKLHIVCSEGANAANASVVSNSAPRHVSTAAPPTLQVYSLTGALLISTPLTASETVIPISKGLYIVKVGNTVRKIPIK